MTDDPSPQSAHGWTEPDRAAALHAYGVLDTPAEQEFDDLASIASEVCGTPIALVNLIDTNRQFFKARIGTGDHQTPPLAQSFCIHAILEADMLIVPDASRDPRFACNPLITSNPKLRFYAGALLKTSSGLPIGTVCVMDVRPRELDAHQIRTLKLLARQAMTQLELRRSLAERERALGSARAAEARQRQIVDSATDFAIIATDLDSGVTAWNTGAERILGWRADEMLGRTAEIFFTAEDRAFGVPEMEMRHVREKGRGADERWHLRKDASRFWASGEMMPLLDDRESHIGYLKILRDRTEEHRDRERLMASESALRAANAVNWEILESISDAFYAVDRDWRFTYVNRRAEALWRRSREELIGKVYWEEFPQAVESQLGDAHRLVIRENRHVRLEIVSPIIKRWVDVDVHPTARGGLSVYFRDITDRKRAEQERTDLSHEMAHRLKNTLAMVQSIAAQTFRQVKTVEEGRDAIIGRIAALARAQDILTRSSWDAASIHAVVDGALVPHRDAENRFTVSGSDLDLTAQQGLGIALAIHELATNAAKYGSLCAGQGRVAINWDVRPDRSFRFEWIESDGSVPNPPDRIGFGTRLLERVVPAYFSGTASLDYNGPGLHYCLNGTVGG